MSAFPYIYRWDRCDRKGQLCRVFARGTKNSIGLEFEDGFTMVTSGNALKKAAVVSQESPIAETQIELCFTGATQTA